MSGKKQPWCAGKANLAKIKKVSQARRKDPVSFFCEFLRNTWMDNTPEEALKFWRRQVEQFPWYADDALFCTDYVLQNPPENLVALMQEHGWIVLDVETRQGKAAEPTFEDYIKWLKDMRDEFGATYDSA